jgi:hypothetical protein
MDIDPDFIDPDFVDPDNIEAPKGASSLPEERSMLDNLTGTPRKGDTRKRPAWLEFANKAARGLVGGVEAVGSLGTGVVSMATGAAQIPHQKLRGSTDDAEKIYTDTLERGTWQPRTEEGEAIMEPIGKFINGIGIPMAGIGRLPRHRIVGTNGRIPYVEPPAKAKPSVIPPVVENPSVIAREIRRAKKEAEAAKVVNQEPLFVDPDGVATPSLATKITEAPEVVALARENARKLEMEAKGLNETMFVDPSGTATRELPKQIKEEAGVVEAVKREQAQELQATAREMELPKNEQLDLFQPEQRAIAFEFGKGDEIVAGATTPSPALVEPVGPKRVSSTLSGPLEVLPMEERPVKPDTIKAPTSPQMLEAKAVEQKKVKTLSNVLPEAALKEWLDVNTREEAFHLAKAAKDIGSWSAAREMASGIQGVTINSGNNPVLKYARKIAGDARAEITKFSQEYITNKETGLASHIQKLDSADKVAVMEALLESDRHQYRMTNDLMRQLGFKKEQISFVEQYQKTADALYQKWNVTRKDLGFKEVPYREGWFPGIFKGGYKTLVTNAKGEIIGMIASDTKYQQRVAKAWYEKKHPGSQFSSTSRADLGKTKVDFFSGLNDVLAILAKEDPAMAKVLEKSQEAQKVANNDLYSIGGHELQKKGIIGNEGNRPWLDKKRNAEDALKAMIDYFEQASEHHSLQKPLHEMDVLMKASETDHMPNVRQYLQRYTDHITGKTGDLGRALNQAIDLPFKALGVSSSIPLKTANTIKAGMGRLYMGYYNPGFLASQLVQPFQMAYPMATMFSERLGLPVEKAVSSMGKGSVWASSETLAAILGDDRVSIAPSHIKEAIQYAYDRGLYAFNDLEAAQSASKSKVMRAHNNIADFMIGAGDRITKLPVFLGYVELFKEAGLDTQLAFKVAEKATETSMVNYHPWERPMLYNKLGALGQFAGGLTTYKHGSMTAMSALAKEKGNKKPILLAAMATLTLAGITGVPAYQELDALYSKLSELSKGKPGSIREDVLYNLPEYLKSGVISTASNLNMQAKWSSADMVPDSLAKAASPHLEGAAQIAIAAAEYAKDPSTINRNNLLMKLTPSGMKGFTEEAFMKDDKGRVLGKDGLPRFEEPRSEEDWAKRKWTGVGLLDETLESQDLYKDRMAQAYKEKQISDMAKKIKSAYTGNEIARTKLLLKEYTKLAGPDAANSLIKGLSEIKVNKQKSERERRQGIPTNLKGVDKYKEYNDGN